MEVHDVRKNQFERSRTEGIPVYTYGWLERYAVGSDDFIAGHQRHFTRKYRSADELSAPYRLDCALTYRLPSEVDPQFAPQERASRELSTAEWTSILDKAWANGIPHIIFTGGEPTLREDLIELILHAENLGQVTGLLTDGIRMTERLF